MTPLRHSAILAALLCGTAAQADVTAQQVWDNWTNQMGIYGQGFTTTGEAMTGDTLTISGVKIALSDDETELTADIGDINLTENGDGTVTITMTDSYPMTLDVMPSYGDPSTVNMLVENDGLSMTVSGDPDALTYDFTADRYAIKIDSLEGDAAAEVDLQDAAVTMFDMVGCYSVMQDTLNRIGYDFTIGAIDIDILFREAGGEGVVKGNADMADLIMSAKMATPQDMDMTADQPPFVDGLAFEGGYSFGDLRYAFDFNADGEAASGTATSEGGQLAFSFDVDGASYIGETRGIDVSLLIPDEFPFPIEASMAQYGFDFRIPLSQGDDGPRDARMAFNFTELAISDMLWGLFDQGAVLPRDPITVAVGIDAQVTPFFDFLDPAQQEAAMMSDIPGELNSATITDLTIKGAGAEITGDGAFTFDNSDLETFDGLPRPTGQVNFAINGANALIDNLIAMGLIPQDEAMMPRMMMGMFTTPVGDDMLTSTIEINNEGHVLANGQRLR